MAGNLSIRVAEQPDAFHVVRVRMCTNDDFNLFNSDRKIRQSLFHMAEKIEMPGIDQDAGGPVDKVSIAVVGCHGIPGLTLRRSFFME